MCINSTMGGNGTATDGECKPDCKDWQVPLLIISSIVLIFSSGLGQSGLVLITLRSVYTVCPLTYDLMRSP